MPVARGGKMNLEPVFVLSSIQESSKNFIFIFQKIIPRKKKIHNTGTEKKSDHLISNNLKTTYPK